MKVNAEKIIDYIKQKSENSNEITYRKVEVKNVKVNLVYVDCVASSADISQYIVKSIFEIVNAQCIEENINQDKKVLISSYGKKENKNYLFKEEFESKIYASSIKQLDLKKDDIFYYLYSGFVLFITQDEFLAIELKRNLERSVNNPTTEGTINGSKDAFVESYKTNIGLIRRRIKTEKLITKEKEMGRITKTKIGILYISDIAKCEHVKKIEEKLNKIDIDGILDSNNIREIIISKGSITDFPTIINTERPDVASSYLLEGRIAIIVDNCPYVLILPSFLSDNFKNIDDYHSKSTGTYFLRLIRILAFIITLITPGLYIALTTFNQEALPTQLLVSFAIQRSGVPFPAFLEALMMTISFEFLKEGDNRVAGTMGSTLSIVGALIIGDAAVSAGIVSPIMIIVIAMTKITGLLFPDVSFSNAIRNWRLIFLILSSMAGLFGFMIALIIFIFKIASISILDTPYTYPFAPVDKEEIFSDTLDRKNITKLTLRKKVLTDNITRLKVKAKEV